MFETSLFTSESVSAGHPDKICDQISDAILDACLAQDPGSRVAVETAIKGHRLFLLGEISTEARIDAEAIARHVLAQIGYGDPTWGLDLDRLEIQSELSVQSPEIAAGVGRDDSGAGDQGLMFGYATAETPNAMPLPIALAHALMRRHDVLRRGSLCHALGPDAKAQVTVARDRGRVLGITDVVLSSQHALDLRLEDLRELMREEVVRPTLGDLWNDQIRLHLNPAGSFIHGGPAADAGLTGRKIIVDTYGGAARHGGGAFSGKDATKVDRSAAYAARQLARDVITRGWARSCEVQIAYAIGRAAPVSLAIDAEGAISAREILGRYAEEGIDLEAAFKPQAIIHRLGLRRPIFAPTAVFGHFGRDDLPWEAPLRAGERLAEPLEGGRAPIEQSSVDMEA
ncbi:methionine adenosyltransferase [Sinirhodobacter sp. WL0062]|uniref:Methionine adenosyltransferase n=1 Tax=Rhodobacter flavimaris TaxID=2907145 RepID=A0ABS8YY50_9RHOB|nr:methionine adenosyltransferase [Sinirhodobacter sp. WL0062]MCE5972620.1 methionine adenosyltransferase [Sinirhodobacter sp. WL0062]